MNVQITAGLLIALRFVRCVKVNKSAKLNSGNILPLSNRYLKILDKPRPIWQGKNKSIRYQTVIKMDLTNPQTLGQTMNYPLGKRKRKEKPK